jgi:hypothetical protein
MSHELDPRTRGRRATPLTVATLLVASLGLCAALSGGCAAPAVFAYKVFGPPPVPPRYAPPKTETMLVLVENPHSGAIAIPEADELSRVIYEELEAQKVAPQVDPAKLHELRDRDTATFDKMSIAEIGRAVGAKQVLYVHVDRLDVETAPGSDMVKTRIAASLKVIDATSAMTAWPNAGDTELFEHQTPYRRIEAGTTPSQLKREILRDSGVELARWFYPWQPETMTDENRDVKLR